MAQYYPQGGSPDSFFRTPTSEGLRAQFPARADALAQDPKVYTQSGVQQQATIQFWQGQAQNQGMPGAVQNQAIKRGTVAPWVGSGIPSPVVWTPGVNGVPFQRDGMPVSVPFAASSPYSTLGFRATHAPGIASPALASLSQLGGALSPFMGQGQWLAERMSLDQVFELIRNSTAEIAKTHPNSPFLQSFADSFATGGINTVGGLTGALASALEAETLVWARPVSEPTTAGREVKPEDLDPLCINVFNTGCVDAGCSLLGGECNEIRLPNGNMICPCNPVVAWWMYALLIAAIIAALILLGPAALAAAGEVAAVIADVLVSFGLRVITRAAAAAGISALGKAAFAPG